MRISVFARFAGWLLALGGAISAMAAQISPPANAPILHSNQQAIAELSGRSELQTDDYRKVLAFVLSALPSEVKVLPTENYYYFWFYHQGIKYAGNLRFDIADRDKGIVHFAYFKALTPWNMKSKSNYYRLGAKDGVQLKKTGRLEYTLSFDGKTVVFALNDLAGVKPPASVLQADEDYIGPIFDESGLSFFLIFNRVQKVFHYVLNETGPAPEQWMASNVAKEIVVGQRTGFAFYTDKYAPRKILIGVYQGNSDLNNYLDGPFDQLPDNFIKGDVLRQAILAVSPDLKGKIDRLGNFDDNETRFLIAPYITYEKFDDLQLFVDCAGDSQTTRGQFYRCLSFDTYIPGGE